MSHNIPQRLNALDVDQQRNWGYKQKVYNGRGRPTDTIVGTTVEWVRTAMELSDRKGIKFFILHGLQQEPKQVCVVHHICGTTLYVECIKYNISFYAVFNHIWELIPFIPAQNNAYEATVGQVTHLLAGPGGPSLLTVQEIAERRVRRTTAMRDGLANDVILAQERRERGVIVMRVASSTEARLYR